MIWTDLLLVCWLKSGIVLTPEGLLVELCCKRVDFLIPWALSISNHGIILIDTVMWHFYKWAVESCFESWASDPIIVHPPSWLLCTLAHCDWSRESGCCNRTLSEMSRCKWDCFHTIVLKLPTQSWEPLGRISLQSQLLISLLWNAALEWMVCKLHVELKGETMELAC